MNCPICGTPMRRGVEQEAGGEIVYHECPRCTAKPVGESVAAAVGFADPIVEYHRHATPEQLRELLEGCPADVPTLQAVLSALWVHHCEAIRCIIQGGADTPSMVRLALLRSKFANELRPMVKKGGAT